MFCPYCNTSNINKKSVGCTGNMFQIFPGKIKMPSLKNTHGSCVDCNCASYQPHHPGCQLELCPKCKKQRIKCPCRGRSVAS